MTQNETFTRDPYKYDPTSDPLSIAAVALENVPGDFLTPAEQIELILGIGHYLNRHRLGGMKGISISPDALFFAQRAEGLATNHRLEELRIRAGLARSMFLYCAEKFEAAGRAASRFVKSADDLAALGASAYDFALYLGLGGQHKRAKELWQLSSTFVTENSIYGDPSWIYHTGFLIGFSSGDRKFTEYCLDRFSGEADRTHPLMKVAALRDEAMWRASVAHRVAAVEEFSQAEAIATDLGLEHQAWVARRMGQLVAKLPKQSLSLEWLNHYSALKGGEPKSSHQGNGEVEPAP